MAEPIGVILSGGQGRRMGGRSKADLVLGGQTLLQRAIARLEPQVAACAVNANAPVRTDLPVLADALPDHQGPLAGILAALDWAAALGRRRVVTVPVDTPFFPCDLVPMLVMAAEGHPQGFSLAASATGVEPIFGLWPVALRDDLAEAVETGNRKVIDWANRHAPALARFPESDPSPFFNINTPADLERAEAWIA